LKITEIEKKKWDEKSTRFSSENQNWSFSGSYDCFFSSDNTLIPVHNFFTRIDEPGITILDYGCGPGWTTLFLATKAERVNAFDISAGQIGVLNQYIRYNNIPNIIPLVADGTRIPYQDQTFDYVFGNAILHHIPLEECLPEIHRVLKPGGRAAFCEPFAENPFINLFRYLKHHFVEKFLGSDRPLKYADFSTFQKYFSSVEFIESSFIGYRSPRLKILDNFLKQISFLKRFVAYITILLEKSE
jgi:ubiquinone/menaquinone biosynthesis C-methylase UbiE